MPPGEDGAGAVDDDTNLVLMQVFGILDVEVPILLADEVGFKLQDWSGPLEQLFPLRRTARREEDRVRFKLRLSIGPGLGEKHDVFAALFRADLFQDTDQKIDCLSLYQPVFHEMVRFPFLGQELEFRKGCF